MKPKVGRSSAPRVMFLLAGFASLLIKTPLNAATIQDGSVVTMHYTLTVNGKVIDSSVGKNPLVYTQGTKQIIPGLEEKLAGLKAGDKTQVKVAPEKGYGKISPDAIQKIPREALQNYKDLKVGSTVTGQSNNRTIQAVVRAINKETVTIDLNHPLAGKTLNFDVEIVNVRPADKN